MRIYYKKRPPIMVSIWMFFQVATEGLEDQMLDFGVILDLKSYYALVSGRWIRGDVGKVAIQGNEYGVKFLGFSDNILIKGISREVFPQPIDFMPILSEGFRNGI